MLPAAANLADLFRVLGLNQKFLRDRLRELQDCPSFSLPQILSLFPNPNLAMSVQRFLSQRFVNPTPE